MGEGTPCGYQLPAQRSNGKRAELQCQSGRILKSFLSDGDVPIDNSASERSIRTFCVGKKNWVLHNTIRGAQASAVLYSITETAKLNNLNPYYYLMHLLTKIPMLMDAEENIEIAKLEHLLPWSKELPVKCYKPRR